LIALGEFLVNNRDVARTALLAAARKAQGKEPPLHDRKKALHISLPLEN
jgi:hypothetical protein